MKENWLPCSEFEDYYMVSDLGRVLNIKKNKIIKISMESIFKYSSKGEIFCMFKYCILEVGLKKYDHFLYS